MAPVSRISRTGLARLAALGLFAIISFVFYSSCNRFWTKKKRGYYSMAAATNPGTCNFEGKIMEVIEAERSDSGTACGQYPCRAKVKLLRVFGCASAVSVPLPEDGIVVMKFAYTLHDTNIFPGMKTHFPGLKKGNIFLATAMQHIATGAGNEFVVYDYEKE